MFGLYLYGMKTINRSFLVVLFVGLSCILNSQSLVEERKVDWSKAGLTEAFTNLWTEVDILNFGGSGDSISDNSTALNNAISSLNGANGVILFPNGKFLFNNSIELRSGIVIRGQGSENTELIFDFNGTVDHCINISNPQSAEYINVIADAQKELNYIIPEFISSFNGEDYADLRQENASWDTNPISWATNVVGQIIRIQEIRNDSIFLLSPLRLDFDTDLNLKIRPISLIYNVGIECLKIRRRDEPTTAAYNIYISHAGNCWIRGIESSYSGGSHIYISQSTNILIDGSYFHHAFKYDGVGTNGYGITLNNRAGECLIQNNVFRFLRHAMMVKTGANGNVFAYNYSLQPNRSEAVSDLSGDISLHGHYAFANLFEGNIVQNIIIDHFWGPSGPNNTFFRNRAELYGLIMTTDQLLETSQQNFLGNEITNASPFLGNYILTGTNHLEYANNVNGNFTPLGTTSLDDQSFYLNSVPDFWIDQDSWPSLGSPNTIGEGIIPAKERYEAIGQITVCPDYLSTGIKGEAPAENLNGLEIYPNPVYEILNIKFRVSKPQLIRVNIRDLTGKIVFHQEWYINHLLDEQIKLNSLEAGIYFLSFRFSNDQVISRKIIRLIR